MIHLSVRIVLLTDEIYGIIRGEKKERLFDLRVLIFFFFIKVISTFQKSTYQKYIFSILIYYFIIHGDGNPQTQQPKKKKKEGY